MALYHITIRVFASNRVSKRQPAAVATSLLRPAARGARQSCRALLAAEPCAGGMARGRVGDRPLGFMAGCIAAAHR